MRKYYNTNKLTIENRKLNLPKKPREKKREKENIIKE